MGILQRSYLPSKKGPIFKKNFFTKPWAAAQLRVGGRLALRLWPARRPVALDADAFPVHHAGPDRRLEEADLPAAHGEDQAGTGELPALRASCGAGGRAPEALSISRHSLSAYCIPAPR